MENWNPSVITEIALTEHTRRVARVDREGWQRPARRGRSPRARLAAPLLALAERLAPALRPPPVTSIGHGRIPVAAGRAADDGHPRAAQAPQHGGGR